MNTIGGHEREALEWACGNSPPIQSMPYSVRLLAYQAVHDPFQLTALLKASTPLLVDATAEDGSIVLCYFVDANLAHRTVDMPEARRVLLGLLTSEDHLKILRGEK
jgi:hypothetical protein